MKARLTGMGSFQGAPTASSYLVITYQDRLEDGAGSASVSQYFATFHPETATWRDAHTGQDLLLPITLTRTVRLLFTEVFRYVDRPEVRTEYTGWAAATNLDGTEIDYTQMRPPAPATGSEPLTMQAARDLLAEGETLNGVTRQLQQDVTERQADNDRRQDLNDETVTAMGSVTDDEAVTLRYDTPGPMTWTDYPEWAMRGWGSPVGDQRAGANRTVLVLRQVDPARPITRLTIRYRLTNGDQPVITERTLENLNLPTGVDEAFAIIHDVLPNGQLWFEFETDGKCGLPNGGQQFPVAQGSPAPRYISLPVGGPDWADGADAFSIHLRTEHVEASKKLTLTRQMESLIYDVAHDVPPAPPVGELLLPDTLYAVAGTELNVYHDNILASDLPESHFSFRVRHAGNLGQAQNERYAFTPTAADAGTQNLNISLYYLGQQVSTATAALTVVPRTRGAGVTRKLLMIGDSTTDYGWWLSELRQLFAAEGAGGMTVTQLGTRPALYAPDPAVRHEAFAGTTTEFAYAYPDSPFTFDGGVFDFGRYLQATGQAMQGSDWVGLAYGINDMVDTVVTTDEQAQAKAASIVDQYNAMIASIKAAVPGARVFVVETIPPSRDQDAFGANYNTIRNRARYMRNHHILLKALKAAFEGRTAQGVHYVAFGSGLDTVHNMSRAAAAPVNARSAVQVQRQDDALHPALSGYQQMADRIYAFLKAQEA